MRVICEAYISDDRRRNSFCECVRIIGGVPEMSGETVKAEYDGDIRIATKYIQLFEQCKDHKIITLCEK